ncbi:MAG TPA: hypothetical protein VG148_18795 [Pyrinomonadaceae bacterium]|nr:hypothetical protein [Pyrinomonadaceae bacterium]
MRNHRAASAAAAVCFAAAASLFVLAAAPARAQQQMPPGPPPDGARDPFAEMRERQRREAQLRSAEMLGTAKPSTREAEAAAAQMREDFRRIQILRNNVARHVLSGKPLDYKFITGEAEEINKRAGRLKANLVRGVNAGEKKEPEKPAEIEDDRLKDALVTICLRIDSFTENPVFKTPDVVDVEQTAKAGRDLRDIIRLSDAVRKAADRLNKAARK